MTFIVKLRLPERCLQIVRASVAEVYDDHLVLLNSDGRLAALFLLDIVESWSELADARPSALKTLRVYHHLRSA
jgi:hypothetical protein